MVRSTITIQHIAEKLNISKATVSRALNDHPKISDATKQIVFQKAKELGYQPNIPNLLENKTSHKSIAIITPEIKDQIYVHAIAKVQELLTGYHCLIACSQFDLETEKALIENFLTLGVSGFFISLCDNSEIAHIQKLIKTKIPTILFNNVNFDLCTQKIAIDNFQGVYNATEHLLSMNCRNIAITAGDSNSLLNLDIQNGYKAALSYGGFPAKPENIYLCRATNHNYIFHQLLSNENSYDGIIFHSEEIAMQFVSLAKTQSMNACHNIRIMYYGNTNSIYHPNHLFSTIEHKADKVGELAVKCFVKQLDSDTIINNTLIIPSSIIIRSSTLKNSL